ncbi:MAG: tRNA (guanosine(37)-N1)-methyltransferase TrmD [Parasporobacterium sp.]|nr:tRNA (guanosine(37)-N1)-methyltransferase TrmD [Parasporobacterium sp.]
MKFNVLTLFPEMIEQGINTSITGRAIKEGYINLNAVNIRDYTNEKHGHVDDYPYGGGAGMVMQAQPVYDAYKSIVGEEELKKEKEMRKRVVFLTPAGKTFNQRMAEEFAKEEEITFLCGHYEGIDERVLELIVTDNVSIGDYVLTGGELPAMVMMDAISRLVPGVLGNGDSSVDESFNAVNNMLEYPQYTRPEEFMGMKVPEVLLSGHHKNIENWRRKQSLERTRIRRPDLLD